MIDINEQTKKQPYFNKQDLLSIYKPPNMPPQQITNTFSSTPSITQIVAYLIFTGQLTIYFVCMNPLYRNIPILVAYIILTLVVIFSAFITSFIDPSDQILYIHKWQEYFDQNQKKAKENINLKAVYDNIKKYRHLKDLQQCQNYKPFNKSKKNIDQNIFDKQFLALSFCIHCSNYCSLRAKHCRRCQRCVRKFDHHCIWINNCIGQRNYTSFIVMIFSVFIHMCLFLAQGIIISSIPQENILLREFILQRKIISWVYMGIITIFAFLLLNLIILHIYLMCTNQTTYDFLISIKKAEEKKSMQRQQQHQRTIELQRQVSLQNNINAKNIHQQSNIKLQQFQYSVKNIKQSFSKAKKTRQSQIPLQYTSQAICIKPLNNNSIISHKSISKASIPFIKSNKICDQPSHSELPHFIVPCQKIQSLHIKDKIQLEGNNKQFPGFFTYNKSLKLILGQSQVQQNDLNRPITQRQTQYKIQQTSIL